MEKIAYCQFVLLFLGSMGVGTKGRSTNQKPTLPAPNRAPDHVYEERTSTNQAALYRLNGDRNPLHIDPQFATAMGFGQPILHGLCTYGYALRHVLKTYAHNSVTTFKSIKSQFSNPVVPGQTLVTEMWKEAPRRVHFRTKVKETGDVVIKGAYVDFNEDLQSVAPLASVKRPLSSEVVSGKALKSDAIIGDMKALFLEAPELVKSVSGKFLICITEDGRDAGEYILNFDNKPPTVSSPNGQKADVTMKVSDGDFVLIAEEKLNPMQAFVSGKLKITGKIMLAQKLADVFQANAKRRVVSRPSNRPTVSYDESLKSSSIMESIENRISTSPELAKTLKGSFLFQITKDNKLAAEWFLNFNSTPISIKYGSPTLKPDVTIKIDDQDFEQLAIGKLNAMQAFMQGKLKATGKVMLAQKLGNLFQSHVSKL